MLKAFNNFYENITNNYSQSISRENNLHFILVKRASFTPLPVYFIIKENIKGYHINKDHDQDISTLYT